MSNNVILEAKPIGKIKGRFFIPTYQRGYRWTKSQVSTLLNDLWNNCKPEVDVQREYCLQPVVVRKRDEDDYELIDGQQRFTTILILLNYIKREWKPRTNIMFQLDYETRTATTSFMTDISKDKADSNIDFYHIYHADLCIREWVEKNFEDENFMADAIDRLFGFLINKVKVIWYEVCEDEDPIALFTRLNIGRIQLTNAELIKALLLKEYEDDDVDKDQIERSMQWDHIEKELRSENDEVWYFLTTKDARLYPTRIELLFDMMANKRENEKEKYYTFFWFENEIKTKGVKTIWEEIQKNFLQIKEWYSDNLLYHKIGYLISSRTMNMMDIFKKAQDCRKSVFLNELDKMIAESINFQLKDENTYRDLNYEKNYKEISNLLLLFNIESIIKEQVYQRFPFSKYNTAEWSLEHIHAQNSQGLKKKETQIEWVKMHLESIISVNDKGQYDEIIAEMKNIISTNQIETRNVFDELFNKVCNALSEDSDSDYIHTLSNMALLTKNDNAALNNSTFDVKRNQIVSMDQRGAFIPYCTKMVFLKYYTPSSENQIHFWGQKDRIAYIKAMENIIQPYLTIINKTF